MPSPFALLTLLATSVALATLPAQAAPAPPANAPQQALRRVPLSITLANGHVRQYRVEVARTPAEQARGMMFRTSVPPATGMLFPFHPPTPVSFWMKNTLVPLDIIFIGADNRILNIVNAEPLSERPLPSKGAAKAVLELAGGEAARIGLAAGDRVQW